MTNGPREDIVEHPRFEEVLRTALQKNNLHETLGESVRHLVTGRADPKQYVCCDSGCVPCVKDYLRAAEMVLQRLPAEPKVSRRSLRRLWPFARKRD